VTNCDKIENICCNGSNPSALASKVLQRAEGDSAPSDAMVQLVMGSSSVLEPPASPACRIETMIYASFVL